MCCVALRLRERWAGGGVVQFKEGPRRQLRRIDQIAPPNVVAESRKLLLSSTH
jgi:hypothetical protein